jgi:hypothetical protein
MRLSFTIAGLALWALLGFASARASAPHEERRDRTIQGARSETQFLQAGLKVGEKVRLYLDERGAIVMGCTVLDVRGDFVGCRDGSEGTASQPAKDRWYNLRLVYEVERSRNRD